LADLDKAKYLHSPVKYLSSVGFSEIHVFKQNSEVERSVIGLVRQAVLVASPSMVVYYSGIDEVSTGADLLDKFTYKTSRVTHQAGLNGIRQISLNQAGCSGVFEAIDLARSEINNGDVVCVMSDRLPTNSPREVQYNVMSDAASTVTISTSGWLKIVDIHTVYAQQFWNTKEDIEKITASYFTFAVRCIREAMDKSNLELSDIDMVIPHNVSLKSWQLLCQLIDYPIEKVYTKNISSVGHTVSSDLIINLHSARKDKLLVPGMKLLAFTYGFGSSWSAMVLEVQ